jgi:hypothetical protein
VAAVRSRLGLSQVRLEVEREVAELKKRGVVFEEYDTSEMKTVNGIMTGGDAKSAWFKDSEGNIMAIVQAL